MELQKLLQRVVGGEALDPIVGYAVLGSTLGAFHLWGWETKDKRSKSQLILAEAAGTRWSLFVVACSKDFDRDRNLRLLRFTPGRRTLSALLS